MTVFGSVKFRADCTRKPWYHQKEHGTHRTTCNVAMKRISVNECSHGAHAYRACLRRRDVEDSSPRIQAKADTGGNASRGGHRCKYRSRRKRSQTPGTQTYIISASLAELLPIVLHKPQTTSYTSLQYLNNAFERTSPHSRFLHRQ